MRITKQRQTESYDKENPVKENKERKPMNSSIEQSVSFIMRSRYSQPFPEFSVGAPRKY